MFLSYFLGLNYRLFAVSEENRAPWDVSARGSHYWADFELKSVGDVTLTLWKTRILVATFQKGN